ncbi:autotransporter assembly complex family protein [Phenylobacterium sp.]|uniref:autotransporter assembly complex protein TamA n=1 Tax=Phenylobacterium sp. TaxID=1871053 RepID=UPI0035B1A78B
MATPARAQYPRAEIEGGLPPDLRDAIATGVTQSETPARSRLEARRRAREASEDAEEILRSEGYYGYQLDADVRAGEPPVGVVKIDPGPRFYLTDPAIEWRETPPAPDARKQAHDALQIQAGDPARAADVIAAEGRVIARLQDVGYADAVAAPRRVVVDHATTAVSPTFRIVAGQLVRLDGVEVAGRTRTSLAWLQRLAPWRSGEVYAPDDVAELERRLLDTGVYETVTVALSPREKTTAEGLRPVVVSLSDRPRWTVEVGARYATTDGVGVDARWTRYNVLRRADTLQVTGRASTLDSRLGAEVSLPHWRRPQQTLDLGVEGYRTRTDAFGETGAGVRASLTRRFGRTSYLTWGGALDYSEVEQVRAGEVSQLGRSLITAAGLAALSLDRSDDPLDPTRGWRAQGRAEPTVISGDETLAYVRLQGQASAYLPLGENARTVLAARLRLGGIAGGKLPQVPASERFYAGGGGSVRGFGYQAVGPRLPDNTPRGGLSLVEASIEARQQITDRWGVVAFLDAGSVGARQVPGLDDVGIGAGLGARYDLGFGPIRADIAFPLTRKRGGESFQVYLSIGQSF